MLHRLLRGLQRRLAAYAVLSRLPMALLTISVPVLGALSTAGRDAHGLGWLALVGLCAHIFGFALNDIIDQPIDVGVRPRHPLYTGRLSRYEVWAVILLPVPLALTIYAGPLNGPALGWLTLVVSLVGSVVYNLGSKRGPLPRSTAELGLATSVGLLCLSGALVQPGGVTPTAGLYSAAMGTVLLLVNSVPSGLKDLRTDAAAGAQSFVLAAGCRVQDDESLFISPAVRRLAYLLQAVIGLLLVGLLWQTRASGWLIAGVGVLYAYGGLHLRMLLNLQDYNLLKASGPLLSGVFNYVALALVLWPVMSLPLRLYFLLLAGALLLVPLQAGLRMGRRGYRFEG